MSIRFILHLLLCVFSYTSQWCGTGNKSQYRSQRHDPKNTVVPPTYFRFEFSIHIFEFLSFWGCNLRKEFGEKKKPLYLPASRSQTQGDKF